MKNLVSFAVKYPVTIVMIVFGVLLLGYISFDKLGTDLFPDLNNPRIFVEVHAGEKPPEEIERQYVSNIEALSIRQQGVTQVYSSSRVGMGQVTVEYSWDKDMDEAFLDLQRALTGYSQNEEIEELTISRHDPNAAPVMIIGLSYPGNDDMNDLRKVAENYIRNELIRLEGIADVTISGQEEREVVIETSPYLLEAHNLTAESIAAQVRNFNTNVSGGSIEEMNLKYVIKGVSIFTSLEDLENLVVGHEVQQGMGVGAREPAGEGQVSDKVPVFLKDVAKIRFENAEPVNITRLNQQRCLGLSVYKETRFNTVRAVEALEKAIEEMGLALPGYKFQVVENQGDYISSAIGEVEESALMGISFAVLVLFVFLRRMGPTLIISIAIPVSIVATFNLMYFNGLTLNIMTLGGLALGAGMLVDNAIVVMENIYRNRDMGMSVKEAAIKGTAQVGGAITASTITTVIVFLPIVYLHGASGELFKDQAWTVAFSLVSSLFVAIFVIPMLFSSLVKNKTAKKVEAVRISWYGRMLEKILRFRWAVMLLACGLLSVGYYMATSVGSEYMPTADSREFSILIKLPEGTRLERTVQATENIEAIIRSAVPESRAVLYSESGPTIREGAQAALEGENEGYVKVILTDSAGFSAISLINKLSEVLSTNTRMEVTFVQNESALQSILGTDSAPMVVEVSGKDFGLIEEITRQVQEKMAAMDDLYNINNSLEEGTPEIEVKIDRLRASRYDVSISTISGQIADRLQGTGAGQLDHEGELKDIFIKLPEVSRSDLESITINASGNQVPIGELAEIRESTSPREILRRNQNRIATVASDVYEHRPFDQVVGELETSLSGVEIPSDYKISIEGDEKKRRESMDNLSFAMILSIILVYMVLASQFESLVHPFTILLTIPLAGVGAIMVFYFTGLSLNIMAYIGIIMLAGIAVNDSIILVDAINQLKEEGNDLMESVVRAGQYRIRPILMTSITTILALLPLTFGFGESASLRQPMALAVIGGLVTSTVLTLIVIPCVYYIFDKAKDRLFSLTKRA